MSKKALVLSSGGVDSTTCIAIAEEEFGAENVSTVSIFYGQKHHKELEQAKKIADYYKLKHYELDLSQIMSYSNCSLLSHSNEDIKHLSYKAQIEENGEGKVETYVPFRNGLMLSSVAALAMSIYPDDFVDIYLGAHADDAAGEAYADCSPEFSEAMDLAINIGTYGKVSVVSPLIHCNKAEVIEWGLEINTPYQLTWSCYEGGEKPCGVCATCIDRGYAFDANNISDPAIK